MHPLNRLFCNNQVFNKCYGSLSSWMIVVCKVTDLDKAIPLKAVKALRSVTVSPTWPAHYWWRGGTKSMSHLSIWPAGLSAHWSTWLQSPFCPSWLQVSRKFCDLLSSCQCQSVAFSFPFCRCPFVCNRLVLLSVRTCIRFLCPSHLRVLWQRRV